jgi:NAD(P)-dependent dehydrogenase (short-subunit alcohol dehydrogenase family)
LLQKSSHPKVIMMTSSVGSIIGAQEPLPGGTYEPSKAALNWITRALHLQHARENLVAVALHPGWVQTRSGEFAAMEWRYADEPPLSVDESVAGMLDVIDRATRATTSGQFVTYEGEVVPW